jgi:hypothetical protein
MYTYAAFLVQEQNNKQFINDFVDGKKAPAGMMSPHEGLG